ncbi:SUMF1/EgtB/PvdO family nonheme iron enzyme [Chitinophaga varians]|uniref:SUMF1/EgtB/PvdO family nonheme iron enzyme n=1 Tax=Chitinophaga varians TaxID=2202339 RepID=A0A847RNT2_9BACT|nr:SUMF1/EgtB/PvdO family nonheme iron enzyme [Chitinophaga varians]NLR63294.1 SUMF1/EgtB/PvdO family nonheme iron enzyme [Chitinophaga varians]
MSVTQIYDRQAWNALSRPEAEAILQQLIQTRFPEFTIKRFETFEKFAQRTFTAVLDHDGAEFVFVPGDTVTLGLDSWNIATENREHMAALFNNDIGEMDNYIRERLSPVRTVTVSPMIVERAYRATGYFPVELTDERLTSDEYFEKTFAEVKASPREHWSYTVNDTFRLVKDGDHIQAWLYEGVSRETLTKEIQDTGFRLPTEDEWEYLCGGGSRSIYPWGDSMDYDKNYLYFKREGNDEENYLESPNHFGLVIANNPYHYEVMMDSEWFLKGGDGGCNLCGGGGLDLGYLSVGTYFRDPGIFDDDMNYAEEITGDYTFVRRVKRIL